MTITHLWRSIFRPSLIAIGLLAMLSPCLAEAPGGEIVKYGNSELRKTPAQGRIFFGDSGFLLEAPPNSFRLEYVDQTIAPSQYLYPWLGTPFGRFRMHAYPTGTTQQEALQKSVDILDERKKNPNNTAYSFLRSESLTTREGLPLVVGYFGYPGYQEGYNIGKISFYFRSEKCVTYCICCEPWSKYRVDAAQTVGLVVRTLREGAAKPNP